MFRGRFEHTMDAKGRLSIPAKFRDFIRAQGEERIMVTNYFENCLVAYTLEEWRRIEEGISELSDLDRDVRNFKRFFLGGAVELALDKQGRILIPPSLRNDAELDHDVVLQGLINKFEIWSRERWEQEISRSRSTFEESAQALAESGLNI